ncbi:cobalt transporter, partial [Salmonella enterica subsp. enterica serovar Typhi]|nr:cobalt transporter [Salmonella enterica subsp. enterica serovar Typhi]
ALTGIGFALLLVVVSEFAGGIQGWRQGVLWGLAGYAVVVLAPGLGLPPELPAMPAGDLFARQVWWIGTALATGVGLWLIAFKATPALSILGLALIVVPHIIGAPQPADYASPIPEGLHHDYVVMVMVTTFLFWTLLGGAIGLLRTRFAEGLEAPQHSIA